MSRLAHLISVVEAKSGRAPLRYDPKTVRAQLGFDPDEMRLRGYDRSTLQWYEQFYERLESYMKHPLISEYLSTLTPTESYAASGAWVATLEQVRDCSLGEGNSEAELFAHGYIAIAGDGCGNSVSFHAPSGRVIFAHHERTEAIVAGDVTILSEEIASFLDDFLHDKLADRLDELD